jgi:hypothetical protein
MKINITFKYKGQEILNLKRRTEKYSERSIEMAALTQIPNQQKQPNGRNHHRPLNISSIWQKGFKRKI